MNNINWLPRFFCWGNNGKMQKKSLATTTTHLAQPNSIKKIHTEKTAFPVVLFFCSLVPFSLSSLTQEVLTKRANMNWSQKMSYILHLQLYWIPVMRESTTTSQKFLYWVLCYFSSSQKKGRRKYCTHVVAVLRPFPPPLSVMVSRRYFVIVSATITDMCSSNFAGFHE